MWCGPELAKPSGMKRFVRTALAAICLFALPNSAFAVPFTITGNATGSDATAEGELTYVDADTILLSLTNTSLYDARITGLGFDLIAGDYTANNSSGLDGYTGDNVLDFDFTDAALGNVPQFGNVVLDFGWLTGNSFTGGLPNDGLAPGGTLNFTASGDFLGLSEAEIADALFVRFQRVGPNGQGSDVGTPGDTPDIPEPASLLLFGLGLAGAAAVRRRV